MLFENNLATSEIRDRIINVRAGFAEDRLMFPAATHNTFGNMTLEQQYNRELLGKALGRIASGVYVVTAVLDGQRHGMLATWIGQIAFQPPAVSIAINKERGLLGAIKEGTAMTVNVLSNSNMDIFKAFAKPAKAGDDDRFVGLALKENGEGAPIFADAVSYLNCRIFKLVDAGDHVLALAEVTGGEMLNSDREPMVHLRNNGFQY